MAPEQQNACGDPDSIYHKRLANETQDAVCVCAAGVSSNRTLSPLVMNETLSNRAPPRHSQAFF